MSETVTLSIPRSLALDLRRQLDELLTVSPTDHPGTPGLFLPDDNILWDRHSGLIGHSEDPEWEADDLPAAKIFYRPITGKAKVLLDLLIDHPGRQLDVDQIIELTGDTFLNSRSIAGSINGMRKAQEVCGRRYPFYWWEGDPAVYAMKSSVADLLRRARENLS